MYFLYVDFYLPNFFLHSKAQNKKPLKFNYVTTTEGQVHPASVKAALSEDVIFQLLTLPVNFDQCQLINPREKKVYNIKPGSSNGR